MKRVTPLTGNQSGLSEAPSVGGQVQLTPTSSVVVSESEQDLAPEDVLGVAAGVEAQVPKTPLMGPEIVEVSFSEGIGGWLPTSEQSALMVPSPPQATDTSGVDARVLAD